MSVFDLPDWKEELSTDCDLEKKNCISGHTEKFTAALKEVLVYIYVTNGRLELNITGETQTIKSNEYTVLYLPEGETFSCTVLEDSDFFTVRFLPDALIKRIGRLCCFIEKILDNVTQNSPAFLAEEPIKANPDVTLAISEVQTAMNKTEFQAFFLEACGFKLMGLFLEQLDMQHSGCGHIRQADIDKMYLVRTLIEKNIHKPLSISELAKEAGTNAAYLKQQFKEIFGTTVYGYTIQYRMELSMNLLKNSQYSISDIAFQVGYKHATHFTQAFKKYFGYLPNMHRKIQVLLVDFYMSWIHDFGMVNTLNSTLFQV